MTYNHRRWHAWAWLVLGPFLVAGFVVSLLARPAPHGAGDTPKAPGKTQPREATP
jgi:hypothetical protein